MRLNVIMLDTHRTYIAITCENESMPYGRRLVSIELTPEQAEMLKPRMTGHSSGSDKYEEIGDTWLEAVL